MGKKEVKEIKEIKIINYSYLKDQVEKFINTYEQENHYCQGDSIRLHIFDDGSIKVSGSFSVWEVEKLELEEVEL
jgi:hypothetical protein